MIALCNKGAAESRPSTEGGEASPHDTPRRIRWYNPSLNAFEWRKVPESDEEALSLLEGAPYSATCTQTFREWRQLGASIEAALIRAGEAARQD
jgi:hypothetical protein